MKQHPKSLMSALNIETDVHSKLSRNSLINKKGWACSLKIKCSFGAVRTLTENTNSVYLELDGQKKSCATLKPLELSTLNSMNTRSLGRGRMSFCRKLYLVFILLLLSPSQRDQQLWEIWSLTVLSAEQHSTFKMLSLSSQNQEKAGLGSYSIWPSHTRAHGAFFSPPTVLQAMLCLFSITHIHTPVDVSEGLVSFAATLWQVKFANWTANLQLADDWATADWLLPVGNDLISYLSKSLSGWWGKEVCTFCDTPIREEVWRGRMGQQNTLVSVS